MRKPINLVSSNSCNYYSRYRIIKFAENMIKGLDDDEIEFLDLVDRTKLAADRRKTLEEEHELNDYRNRVATLQEKALQDKLQVTVAKPKMASNGKISQTKLLLGAVVKKNEAHKRKMADEKPAAKQVKICNGDSENAEKTEVKNGGQNAGMQCIGVLPGIGPYTDSSSEHSSDSEIDEAAPKIDLLGRKISVKKDKDEH